MRSVGVWPVLSTMMLAYHGKETDDVRAALAYREYFGTDLEPPYVCTTASKCCSVVVLNSELIRFAGFRRSAEATPYFCDARKGNERYAHTRLSKQTVRQFGIR